MLLHAGRHALTNVVVLVLIVMTIAETADAGPFCRRRTRRLCRPRRVQCEPCPPVCAPAPTNCNGYVCPVTLIAEYRDANGTPLYCTYRAEKCGYTQSYNMDMACRGTTNCANGSCDPSLCFLSGGMGMPPMTLAAPKTLTRTQRAYAKALAAQGQGGDVLQVVPHQGYLVRKDAQLYQLKQGRELVELYWIYKLDSNGQEIDGFGIGVHVSAGVNPQEISAAHIEKRLWQVTVNGRMYETYLK